MDAKTLKVISELMDKLSGEMEHSPEDLGERLGRKKPSVENVEDSTEEAAVELHEEMMDDEKEEEYEQPSSPDDALKKRVQALRSK